MKQILLIAFSLIFTTNIQANWVFVPEKEAMIGLNKEQKPQALFLSNFIVSKDFVPFTISFLSNKSITVSDRTLKAKFIFKNKSKVEKTLTKTIKRGSDLDKDGIGDYYIPFNRTSNTYEDLITSMINYESVSVHIKNQQIDVPLTDFKKSYNRFFIFSSDVTNLRPLEDMSDFEMLSTKCSQQTDKKTDLWTEAEKGITLSDFEKVVSNDLLEKSNSLSDDDLKELKKRQEETLKTIGNLLKQKPSGKAEHQMIDTYMECVEGNEEA